MCVCVRCCCAAMWTRIRLPHPHCPHGSHAPRTRLLPPATPPPAAAAGTFACKFDAKICEIFDFKRRRCRSRCRSRCLSRCRSRCCCSCNWSHSQQKFMAFACLNLSACFTCKCSAVPTRNADKKKGRKKKETFYGGSSSATAPAQLDGEGALAVPLTDFCSGLSKRNHVRRRATRIRRRTTTRDSSSR